MRSVSVVVSLAALVTGVWFLRPTTDLDSSSPVSPPLDMVSAAHLMNRQPGFFVPNLGQWDHAAKFVHRSGPMTLFLEDRGWVIDLVERPVEPKTKPHPVHQAMPDDRAVDQKIHCVALRMTFEGDACVSEIVGEKKLPGHHNYFLGNDESRWHTGVPLYGSVRYENLYPNIDLRLREANGVPEYDLLLQPGADLVAVVVHVEGAQRLSIASDGSLVIETALGPLTQSAPKTWQMGDDGRKREVVCNFTLLGADRFGFAATGWDGDTSLTIDPGLLWSTFLGGPTGDDANASALSVDTSGVVTLVGRTGSPNFPTTSGAYDTTYNSVGFYDAFVSRLDPSKSGSAQLVYSTFFGGSGSDDASALSVDALGVVTVVGRTKSSNLPTTRSAFDRTHNGVGFYDVFVIRLDPSKVGAAQLAYSTFFGGSVLDQANALVVDTLGVVTVAGRTSSTNFPTISGAYDTTQNGGEDAFVSRLDPGKTGGAQLVYSTFLGGSKDEHALALSVDFLGVVTVAGYTKTANFPTTSGAYNTIHNGGAYDAFVSRVDPRKIGAGQLVYSTFLGGKGYERVYALSVGASGLVTLAGFTSSSNFPTTSGAYDRTFNGTSNSVDDVFVSRVDPSKTGTGQLVYSTFLGGVYYDRAYTLAVDASGVVTVTGDTWSPNFPTTSRAYDTTHNGAGDAFVSRVDPSKAGSAQLTYSTFLGGGGVGSGYDYAYALSVDASGVATLAGFTSSKNFPTTSGAYDRTFNGYRDAFVSRLDMGVALYGDVHAIPITTGGTQRLTVNAGKAHATKLYWIFGSETGTSPGVNLLGVHIPLNPDLYSVIAMGTVNGKEFTKFRGTLDANGLATASFNVPANLPLPSGFTFHHAYVVYDASGKFYMASNAVPLRLK
jgi:hypothetical protein